MNTALQYVQMVISKILELACNISDTSSGGHSIALHVQPNDKFLYNIASQGINEAAHPQKWVSAYTIKFTHC